MSFPVNLTVNESILSTPDLEGSPVPLCVEFPLKLLNAISAIIYINGIFGFLSNLLIFLCYSLFKSGGKKLSTTECFITFLSLADMTFSVSVLCIGISGHVLSEAALARHVKIYIYIVFEYIDNKYIQIRTVGSQIA